MMCCRYVAPCSRASAAALLCCKPVNLAVMERSSGGLSRLHIPASGQRVSRGPPCSPLSLGQGYPLASPMSPAPLQGRTVDFKNTLIIMTSNVGSSVIEKGGGGLGFQLDTNEEDSSYNRIKTLVNEELKQYFRPEFLNR